MGWMACTVREKAEGRGGEHARTGNKKEESTGRERMRRTHERTTGGREGAILGTRREQRTRLEEITTIRGQIHTHTHTHI
jgi:hypothetical protein